MLTDVDHMLSMMKTMAEAELTIAMFYEECSLVWKGEQNFWLQLVSEEKKHAQNIERMAQILSKKPERFESGRPLNIIAIHTFIEGIKANITRLKGEGMSPLNMLFIARDIERALIESKYAEIIKSGDVEFNDLIKEIVEDTERHKGLLDNKIARLQTAK
jgi:hypothetical protein